MHYFLFLKERVKKKSYRPSLNPTLYFIFLQWGSHSFIQIPKVEIICSKCFQRQSAASTYILSRVGRKLWNLLNTNGGVSEGEGRGTRGDGGKREGKMRGKKEERKEKEKKMQKGICWWSICLYCYSYDSLSRSGETYCLPATYFHWQGS